MNPGIEKEIKITVTEDFTALKMGSGSLEVYATPAMVALMEQAAAESVEELLGEGKTSVGTKMEVEHLAATPLGMKVTCRSTLTAVDNRKLTFAVEAYDEAGLIGKAHHERFVIDTQRFLEKTYGKLKK